jgi:hypothetical protein
MQVQRQQEVPAAPYALSSGRSLFPFRTRAPPFRHSLVGKQRCAFIEFLAPAIIGRKLVMLKASLVIKIVESHYDGIPCLTVILMTIIIAKAVLSKGVWVFSDAYPSRLGKLQFCPYAYEPGVLSVREVDIHQLTAETHLA